MSIDRQEPLRMLASAVARIQGTGGTGRLALRNTVRMGTLHLYFELGRLVHVEGSRSTIDECLIDLAGWTDGLIRLDIGVQTERRTVTPEQETFFHRTLLLMQQRGAVNVPSHPIPRFPAAPRPGGPPTSDASSLSGPTSRSGPRPHVPERPPPHTPGAHGSPQSKHDILGSLPDAPPTPEEVRRTPYPAYPPQPGHIYSGPLPSAPGYPGQQPVPTAHTAVVLLSSRQWETLVEAMHAMLEAIGQLFGARQAQTVFEFVLIETSKQSEVLRLLQVDRQGRLHEVRRGEMLNQPVEEVSEAFILLISYFERRWASMLGPERTRQIIARALQPYQSVLAEIGIALNA